MNDRIHAYLDGELSRDLLSEEELAEATALESRMAAVNSSFDRAAVPDFPVGVMAEIHRLSQVTPGRARWSLRDLVGWLWKPRSITLQWRPGYTLVPAFALLALLVVGPPGSGGEVAMPTSVPTTASAADEGPTLYVQFRLEAPEAQTVQLAGTFTGWDPEYPLNETAPGVWTALVPLDPGVHDYTFIIDGQRWVVDPYAPQVDDDFGGSNSRLFLPTPSQGT